MEQTGLSVSLVPQEQATGRGGGCVGGPCRGQEVRPPGKDRRFLFGHPCRFFWITPPRGAVCCREAKKEEEKKEEEARLKKVKEEPRKEVKKEVKKASKKEKTAKDELAEADEDDEEEDDEEADDDDDDEEEDDDAGSDSDDEDEAIPERIIETCELEDGKPGYVVRDQRYDAPNPVDVPSLWLRCDCL